MKTMNSRLALLAASAAIFAGTASADIPAGAGKEETVRVCSRCHAPELVASQRQTRDQWQVTISKMANLGAQASDDEFAVILDYLSRQFGPEGVTPVNVNKATAVEIECVLELTRPESKAIVAYRQQNGPFKSVDDLNRVPGLDFKKIAARKPLVLL